MAIQNRRGAYVDLDPSKLLPGEWGVVTSGDEHATDGTGCYMCFSSGNVKRMATYEDMVDNIRESSGEVVAEEIDLQCGTAIDACNEAASSVNESIEAATEATEAANNATSAAQSAASRAEEAAESIEQANVNPFAKEVKGSNISLNDSADKPIIGIAIYGEAEQAGTPTYDSPQEIYIPGSSGNISLSLSDGTTTQTVQLSVSGGIAGIKVDSGGNYVDVSGQAWACDEIVRNERGTGKIIKRIGRSTVEENTLAVETLDNGNKALSITGISNKSLLLQGGMFEKAKFFKESDPDSQLPGSVFETVDGFKIVGTASDTQYSLYEKYGDCAFIYVLSTPTETNLTITEINSLKNVHTFSPSTTITNNASCEMTISYILKSYQGIGAAAFYGVANNTSTTMDGVSLLDAKVAYGLNNRISALEDVLTQNTQGVFMIDGALKICWGTEALNYQNMNICMSSVFFDTLYDIEPVVVVSLSKQNTASQLDWNPYIVSDTVTTDHCTLACASPNGNFSAGNSPVVFWVAIGY